jgi:hypothetical protein
VKHKPLPGRESQAARYSELVWLLGQPQLSDYLEFVARKVVDGHGLDPLALAAEWREANDLYYELEIAEAGIADTIECLPIDPALEPLADAVRANCWFRESFDNLPSHILKVELDKLVVSQTHVEQSFTDSLGRGLGDHLDEAKLFQFCLPLERPMPPIRIQRLSGDRYVFTSPSTDFRAHHPRLFRPEELTGMESIGPVAAMVGIMVGFGSNFMSAIRSDSRLVLQNGYHRAYTLRSLGFTHAYCVVEDVTRKDELRLTADADVAGDPAFYFAAKRPPILRDFFNARLRKVLELLPSESQIEVELKVISGTATDL